MEYQAELEVAKQLAKKAGEVIRRYFLSDEANAQLKDDRTIVTLADTDINTLVIETISRLFPTHSVHGEEEVLKVENSEFTWVCDPVDGTMPFAKGIPISTFSLALVNKNGESVLGVVYDPFKDRLYEAVVNNGAYMNGGKLSVSEHSKIDGAYIDEELWINHKEGISFDDPKDTLNKMDAKVTTQCSAVFMGCLVASGMYEAMLFGQTKPEDIAALSVIVSEAGGKVTDLHGGQQRYDQPIRGAIVSNGKIHDELVKVLQLANYINPFNQS
jgi:myo-inositol-1(or 4)-monophosphatase